MWLVREHLPWEKVAPCGFSVLTDNPGHLQWWNIFCSLLTHKEIKNSFLLWKQTLTPPTSPAQKNPGAIYMISTSNIPVIHLSEQKTDPAFTKTFQINTVKLSLQAVLMETRLPHAQVAASPVWGCYRQHSIIWVTVQMSALNRGFKTFNFWVVLCCSCCSLSVLHYWERFCSVTEGKRPLMMPLGRFLDEMCLAIALEDLACSLQCWECNSCSHSLACHQDLLILSGS